MQTFYITMIARQSRYMPCDQKRYNVVVEAESIHDTKPLLEKDFEDITSFCVTRITGNYRYLIVGVEEPILQEVG